jgi:uncharacterized protein (DUF2461 family)
LQVAAQQQRAQLAQALRRALVRRPAGAALLLAHRRVGVALSSADQMEPQPRGSPMLRQAQQVAQRELQA